MGMEMTDVYFPLDFNSNIFLNMIVIGALLCLQ